jgi:hypothetical protein
MLNHTILLVDISEIGALPGIYPADGLRQSVQSLRFKAWSDAEQYLSAKGAKQEAIDTMSKDLQDAGVAVLTIT